MLSTGEAEIRLGERLSQQLLTGKNLVFRVFSGYQSATDLLFGHFLGGELVVATRVTGAFGVEREAREGGGRGTSQASSRPSRSRAPTFSSPVQRRPRGRCAAMMEQIQEQVR